MNQTIKIGLYALLGIGALIFGILFYSSYRSLNHPEPTTNSIPAVVENQITNIVDTNAIVTNADEAVSENNEAVSLEESNFVATATNEITATPALAREKISDDVPLIARPPTHGRSTMIGYLGAFVLFAILLGLLIAFDISQFFGNRSVEFLFNDDGAAIKTPEYEEAEQEWTKGNHLEAIRMMREYVTANPREQYVAIRIAEIYEKDLKNHLAAALEYEEILTHKLPEQRWGWAAIHLCNLYSKLGKTDQAVALLRRIVNEYGGTPAAEKARKRLAMFDTTGEEGLSGELPDVIPSPGPKRIVLEQDDPNSNLPPGFRPKK